MSSSLKRAFGLWVAGQVPGLHVHADELANAEHAYPECTVTELSYSLTQFGCGRRDFTVRDDATGFVAASGKMVRAETTYRLTLSAPSGPQGHGQELVDAVLDQLGKAVTEAGMAWGPLQLEDSEADPAELFNIDRIALEGRQSAPPDVSGEPFLCRGALTVRLARTVPLEKPVEGVMEHIHVKVLGG
jgi:hypothetical protein